MILTAMEMTSSEMVINETIKWDKRNWSRTLPFWYDAIKGKITADILAKKPWVVMRQNCLEIGSFNGGLSLWLALQDHDVLCTDVKDISAKVRTVAERYEVADKITYEVMSATDIPYREEFDIIIFKSVLGAIGRHQDIPQIEYQRQAVNEMYKALKPGGLLLFAENLVSTKIHQYLRKRYGSTKKTGWGYLTINEMIDILKTFAAVKYKTQGFLGLFGQNENQRDVLGNIDCMFNPIIPREWNYIMYGAAQKGGNV